MRCAPFWMFALFLIALLTRSSSGRCVCATERLRLRTNAASSEELEPAQLDLSQLSEVQLQQLAQQLDLVADYDEDYRGSSRPWKKVQRIIRRQLVRLPKRYLKKLLRQFGLARDGSFRSGLAQAELVPEAEQQFETGAVPQLYYLIPLE